MTPETSSRTLISTTPLLHVLLTVFTCGSYMVASWWLIIVNRFLMTEDEFGFPFTLAGIGMLFTWTATSILVQFQSLVPRQQEVSRSSYLTRIVPLGLCSAGTMGLGNMAYQYLDVAILEMLKSCCPVFVFLVSVALKLEKFSWPRAISTCLIAGGIAFTTACGAKHVSRLGLALHLGSQVVEALRLCLAQVLMCNMQLHQFEALRQMSSACVLSLGLAAWFFEWHRFYAQQAWGRLFAHPHWYLAAASLGFLLNCTTYGVVKLTGPMTQKVMGSIKTVAMVGISVVFMGDTVNLRQVLGYTTSLIGFAWYRSLTNTRSAQPKAKAQ